MSTYFVNREIEARSHTTFMVDVPPAVERLGHSAIEAYIKEHHYWRDDLVMESDLIVFEQDSE